MVTIYYKIAIKKHSLESTMRINYLSENKFIKTTIIGMDKTICPKRITGNEYKNNVPNKCNFLPRISSLEIILISSKLFM